MQREDRRTRGRHRIGTVACAAALALVAGLVPALGPAPATAAATAPGAARRLNLTGNGAQATGGTSTKPVLSAEGRYVAFVSAATNLASGLPAGKTQVYVRDRLGGTTELVSVGTDALPGDNNSTNPAISADGRYVAFQSDATKMVNADSNNATDVFVRDRTSGTTTRASVTSAEAQATGGASTDPSISADGTRVAFLSLATNLAGGDTGTADVYLRDTSGSGTTSRVSVSTSGGEPNANSSDPAISADGTFVAFASVATNVVSGDPGTTKDVFLRDLGNGDTRRVNPDTGGGWANADSAQPVVNANGRYVAFTSSASDLVSGDTNGVGDTFVWAGASGRVTRASVDSWGNQGAFTSGSPSISDDGLAVAFYSISPFVAEDVEEQMDVYVNTRDAGTPDTAGTTERFSVRSDGTGGNGGSYVPALSPDGTEVAYESDATNLVTADTNGYRDVFVTGRRPLAGGTMVSTTPTGVAGNGSSGGVDVCDRGNKVVFSSSSSNLVPGDTNNKVDVFVRDRAAGTTERVSVTSAEAQADADSTNPSFSGDCGSVVFQSEATNLSSSDQDTCTNWSQAAGPCMDVFVRNLEEGTTSWVSRDVVADPGRTVGDSADAAVDSIGRCVAFEVYDRGYDDPTGSDWPTKSIDLRDTVAGSTTAVTTFSKQDDARDPAIDFACRRIVWVRDADPLTGLPNNRDVWVSAKSSGGNWWDSYQVSKTTAGADANGDSEDPAISADGRWAAFSSTSTSLVSGDANGVRDVFLVDLDVAITNGGGSPAGGAGIMSLPAPGANGVVCLTCSSGGTTTNGASASPAISADGRYVTFASSASNLALDDTNARDDVFVIDTQGGAVTRVSVTASGGQAGENSGSASIGGAPTISANGCDVGFGSLAEDTFGNDAGQKLPDAVVSGGPVCTNLPPTAALTATPTSGKAPLAVAFDAGASFDYDGALTYAWDFGDGTTDSGAATASHTYLYPGTYDTVVTVTDSDGDQATATRTITAASNQPPVPSFTATPTSGVAPLAVAFNGGASYDPDGTITAYTWTFGDGATGTGVTTSHTYATGGTRTARLDVTDDNGYVRNTTRTITVTSLPTANAGTDRSVGEGTTVVLNGSASTSNDAGQSLTQYRWDYDDNGGTPDCTGTTPTSCSYVAGDGPASRTVALTVVDPDGTSPKDTLTVTVTNTAPTLTTADVTPRSGTTNDTTFTYTATATDPAGAAGAADPLTYAWDFDGNGTTDTTTPLVGATTHTFATAGTYTGTVTVTDGDGGTTTTNLPQVSVGGHLPTANAGTDRSVGEGTTVVLNGSASTSNDAGQSLTQYRWDYDDNGGTPDCTGTTPTSCSYVAGDGPASRTVALTVVDPDGTSPKDTLTVTVTNTAPTLTTADVTPRSGTTNDTTFTYTATATDPAGAAGAADPLTYAWDFDGNGTTDTTTPLVGATTHTFATAGTYTGTVTVTDGDGGTTTTNLPQVSVDRHLPTADPGPDRSVGEGVVTMDGSASSPNDDGQSVTQYRWDLDDNGSIDYVSASPTYPFGADGPTVRTVALTVVDPDGTSPKATAQITVTNTAPAISGAFVTPGSGTTNDTTFAYSATAADAAGALDPLSYAWDFDGNGTTDATTGTGTTTHAFATAGTYTGRVTVGDGDGGFTPFTLNQVRVNAHLPTADAGADQTAPEGAPVPLDGSGSSSNDSGQSITQYRWDLDDDGTVDFTSPLPTFGFTAGDGPGSRTVALTVVDPDGTSAKDTTVVTITNAAPTITATDVTPRTGTANETVFVHSVSATDPTDTLSYAWDFDGDGNTDTATGTGATTHTFTTPGTRTGSVQVSDDDGAATTAALPQVSVNGHPPTAAAGADRFVDEGTQVTLDGSASSANDPGQTISQYRWDLDDDGTVDQQGTSPTLTFDAGGGPAIRIVALTVVDPDGTATDTVAVTVTNTAPTITAADVDPRTGTAGATSFAYSATATDPADSLSYIWDFDGNGFADAATGTGSASHVFPAPGRFTGTVAVSDGVTYAMSPLPEVVVGAVLVAPSATLVSPLPATVPPGADVVLAAEATDDLGVVALEWDRDGDGSTDETTPVVPPDDFLQVEVAIRYDTPGTFSPAVRAVDGDGLRSGWSGGSQIRVLDPACTGDADGDHVPCSHDGNDGDPSDSKPLESLLLDPSGSPLPGVLWSGPTDPDVAVMSPVNVRENILFPGWLDLRLVVGPWSFVDVDVAGGTPQRAFVHLVSDVAQAVEDKRVVSVGGHSETVESAFDTAYLSGVGLCIERAPFSMGFCRYTAVVDDDQLAADLGTDTVTITATWGNGRRIDFDGFLTPGSGEYVVTAREDAGGDL